MKKAIILIFLSVALATSAQETIKLKVDNPAPRVGDAVKISFSLQFLSDRLANQLNKGVELVAPSYVYGDSIALSDFQRNVTFEYSGRQVLGPFRFNINGKEIGTDSIVLEVGEKLPIKESISVRYVEFSEKKYLIVEQYIPENKQAIKNTGSDEFAEIMEKPAKGVLLKMESLTRRSGTPNVEEKTSPALIYISRRYEVVLGEDFDGTFLLSSKYFINLPEDAVITPIEIN